MIFIQEIFLWAFQFLIGACIFHFLNVVIYRLPTQESVVQGWNPCRGCGMVFSGRYFLNGCLGGAAFVFCSAFFGSGVSGLISLKGLLAFSYMGILTVVAWIDWDTRVIYDRFHVAIFTLGLVSIPLFPEIALTQRLIGMAVVALPMFLLALLIAGAFGGGDIKLMAASGFLLGWRAMIPAVFLGILTGGVYCIWMLASGKLGRKDHFAFGPFLAIGLGIAYFYGETIMVWYLSAA